MEKFFKRFCSAFLSVTVLSANASAFAHGIWGTDEEIAQQENIIEKYSGANDISWIETTDTEIIIKGVLDEKEGMPITGLIRGNDVVEMMQSNVGTNGYYSFFVSDENFIGAQYYNVKIASGRSSLDISYYHRTAEDDADILKKISSDGAGSVVKNPKLNLNLYNYNLIEDKVAVCDILDAGEYTSVNEFVNAFYDAVHNVLKENTNITYYVSKSGDDSYSGTQTAPFATVTKAYKVASDIIRKGKAVSDINIIIKDGDYTIDKTLYFNENNTSDIYSINFIAENNGKASISGSQPLDGFRKYKDNIYVKNIGASKNIKMLYNNGEMMWIARYPNRGALKYDLPGDYALTMAAHSSPRNGVYINPEILSGTENNPELEMGIWPNGGDNGQWMWYFNIVDVKDTYNTGLVTFEQFTTHDIGRGAKFYVQNDIKFLDAENEFYYDNQSGNLYVWAEDESTLDISLPTVDNMIEFENARNVRFEGIKLGNTERTKDYTYTYQTNDSGCGVRISDSSDITVKNCIVANVGGHGIYLVNGGESNEITGNDIYNTFGTGISINGADNLSEMNFKNNVISNNHIHSSGLVVGNSTGIALYHSGAENNIIKNNCIHDCPRSGIRVSKVNSVNYITYNDIYDVNKGSQDTGVIYVEGLGKNAKTYIENNYIHDSYSWIELTIGLYLDDSAYGTVAKNNIIANLEKTQYNGEDVFGYCMYLKADDIVVENNYVIDNPQASTITGSYAQHSTANNLTISRNVFSNSGNMIYIHENYDNNRLVESDYNLIDTNASAICRVKGVVMPFDRWRSTYNKDSNSVLADACISDSRNLDFRLMENSPAFSLGIKNIDMANIGLEEDFVYNTEDNAPHRVFVREESQTEDSTSFDMLIGQTEKLKVLARNEAGMIVKNVNYTFESENPEIAVVDEKGNVTAKKSGATKIKVTATNGMVTKQSYIIAKVSSPSAQITKLELKNDGSGVVVRYNGNCIGSDIIAAVYDNNGKVIDIKMCKIYNLEANISFDVNCTDTAAAKVRVFIWNLSGMMPVTYEELLL